MLDLRLTSFDFQGKVFLNAVLFPGNGFLGSAVVKFSGFKGENFTFCKAGRRFCCIVCQESLQRCLNRRAVPCRCRHRCEWEPSGSMLLYLEQPQGLESPLIIWIKDDWLGIFHWFIAFCDEIMPQIQWLLNYSVTLMTLVNAFVHLFLGEQMLLTEFGKLSSTTLLLPRSNMIGNWQSLPVFLGGKCLLTIRRLLLDKRKKCFL